MMCVGVVRVTVKQLRVPVSVAMRSASRYRLSMFVRVVFLVDVSVFMRYLRVQVLVSVAFGQVQPDADSHQSSRTKKVHGHRIS